MQPQDEERTCAASQRSDTMSELGRQDKRACCSSNLQFKAVFNSFSLKCYFNATNHDAQNDSFELHIEAGFRAAGVAWGGHSLP
jgi:hypothetical protein